MASTATKYRQKQIYKLKAGVEVLCAICHEPITLQGSKHRGNLTVDHIVPKSLGGPNIKENFQPAHSKCNHRRGSKILQEFQGQLTKEQILRRAIEIIEGDKIPVRVVSNTIKDL